MKMEPTTAINSPTPPISVAAVPVNGTIVEEGVSPVRPDDVVAVTFVVVLTAAQIS